MKRISVREFRATIAKVQEPVLVGQGIWFPMATEHLLALGEGRSIDLVVTKEDVEKPKAKAPPVYTPKPSGGPEPAAVALERTRQELARRQEARDAILRRMATEKRK